MGDDFFSEKVTGLAIIWENIFLLFLGKRTNYPRSELFVQAARGLHKGSTCSEMMAIYLGNDVYL